MFVCIPHVNDNHYHLHVCGSPLEYLNGNSIRQSKKEFREFKHDIQEYQIDKYPELTNSVVRHNLGYERRHEQRFIPATVTYEYMVQQIAKGCSSMAELLKKLEKYNVEIYYRRGDPYGVLLNGRKRRFKTLINHHLLLKWDKYRSH